MPTQKMQRGEREAKTELARVHAHGTKRHLTPWLLFLYVFSSPGPALCKFG